MFPTRQVTELYSVPQASLEKTRNPTTSLRRTFMSREKEVGRLCCRVVAVEVLIEMEGNLGTVQDLV